ncbi:hypothetical protein AAKU67_001220 [Oxalobacteraceae bacterium GrIS 2.11]
MQISNAQTPLFRSWFAGQGNRTEPGVLAPGSNFLVQLSRTPQGEYIGRHSVKYFGGVLIGVGAMLNPVSGLGLGLISAGSAIWVPSTCLSSAALRDKNFQLLAKHLAASALSGACGAGFGAITVPLGLLNFGRTLGDVMFAWTVSGMVIGAGLFLPAEADDLNRNVEVPRTEAAPVHEGQNETIRRTLRERFVSAEQITINQRNEDGGSTEIVFNMEDRQDKLMCHPVATSEKEWIAVQRNTGARDYDLFEASSFYNEHKALRYAAHPYTKARMEDLHIIAGQELLDLLDAASHTQSDQHGISIAPIPELQPVQETA